MKFVQLAKSGAIRSLLAKSLRADSFDIMLKSVLFLIRLSDVLGDIVVAPSNTVVRVGEKLFLECRTNNESKVWKWTHFSTNRSTTTIYKHPDIFHDNFRHFDVQVNADGSDMLYTNSTRSEDAGIYGCNTKADGKDEMFTAQVVVLETLPVCDSNLMRSCSHCLVDGDHIWIECSINFRGFWAPNMEWIQNAGGFEPERKTATDGIEAMISPSRSVTSKLMIALKSSTDGSYYSCKVYFTNYSDLGETTANNIPDFAYTWNSSVLHVSYSSTSSRSQTTSSIDWYLVALSIVSVLTLFLILMLALAIRLKKKASESAMRLSNIPNVANSQQIPSVSLYTEGPPIERATVKLEEKPPGSLISESHDAKMSRPPIYFGDDGTEYMEVNVVGRQPMSASHFTESNMFSVVGEYASIDHTRSPPISPRGKIV